MSDLYHPLILKHNREPHGFLKREDATLQLDAYNPVCGDDYRLYLDIVDTRIQNINFHGYGCAVSKASASILVQQLAGLKLSDAQALLSNFLAMLESDGKMEIPDLAVFSIAKKYPGRIPCATLAWKALAEHLSDASLL